MKNLLPQLLLYAMMATTMNAQGVIDVHSHIITPEFVSALESERPRVGEPSSGMGRLLDEGFPLPKWDAEAQLKWMDEAWIQTSVLTLAAPQPQQTHPQPIPVREGGSYLRGGESPEELSTPLPHREGQGGGSLIRIAEIEVHPKYLDEYLAATKEIQQQSLAEEPGVLCLFPTQLKQDSTQLTSGLPQSRLDKAGASTALPSLLPRFRILEIYASQEAYQHHIQTAHFQRYKQGTLHMVKSLKLQDLHPLNSESMRQIFKR